LERFQMGRPDYLGFNSQRRQGARRDSLRGSLRLGALFTALVGINIYVFFFRGGTSIQDVLRTGAGAAGKRSLAAASTGALPPGVRAAASPSDPRSASPSKKGAEAHDDSIVVQGSMKGYTGLLGALSASKIDAAQITEVIAALEPELNMKSLKPEHRFEARLDPRTGKIRKFLFRLSPIDAVVVSRNEKGALKANRQEVDVTLKVVKVAGVVDSSLERAMSKVGEGSALVSMFVDLFSWDVNWYTDPRDGDEFRIVIEKKFLGDKFYGYSRILAAEYKGKNGRYQVFFHKQKGGGGFYVTPEGRAVHRAFLKMPLNYRRVSSRFDKHRFHPVLHQTKGHYGVDYAAARGTPVWASCDGTVLKLGRFGGAGNMIILSHPSGVNTMYMHLSRFAHGLKHGLKVKQRQVIGYVGSTGLATGPHLHYGIQVLGKYVDPMKFAASKGTMLSRTERLRFIDELPDRMAVLEGIPLSRPASAQAEH
jgi:murein DD-endopeptidase MepM/ murein hydrolase activator NlpD